MKISILIPSIILALLAMATPAIAVSLGVSPSSVELKVPADGSQTIPIWLYHYTGEVQISLVDIPLNVMPGSIQVDAAENPQKVDVTIYGDPSLGSKIYEGYIRFLGKAGEKVGIAVQVKAKVTNLVAGQPVSTSAAVATDPPSPPEVTPAEPESTSVTVPPPPSLPVPESPSGSNSESVGGIEGLSLNLVIIIAGGIIFLGLVILAVSLATRRRRF